MILRAKNWGEFQHYKDRSPTWIKLHRKLLDDRTFHRLPDASRALAPMIWLLASETPDGIVVDAMAEIAFRLRMTEKKVTEALEPLIAAGFFSWEQGDSDVVQSASTAIALCETEASSEKRRVREEEEERAFAAFALAAQRRKWPEPRKLDDDRRKKLRARLDEHGPDGWQGMLDRAEASEFINTKFPLKLDWVLESKNFRKVIEGNYGNVQGAPDRVPEPTVNRDSEGQWQARLKKYRRGGFWMENDWGPRPESGRSRVPDHILAQWESAQVDVH